MTGDETRPQPNSVPNPVADGMSIVVSIPETIDIRMVDAALFSDFELWSYIASITSSVSVGFWVSYVQNADLATDKILLWVSICFTILFAFSTIVAMMKRARVKAKSKKIRLRATAMVSAGE